jgi:hypothetical protein
MVRIWLMLAVAASVGCYSAATSTESPAPVPTPPDAGDPPAQVGRLDLIDGAVSFRPAASDTWALPVPNRVVTTGDRLWVDSVGHAEVEVGPNALRMAPETELDVVHLDDDMVQVRLPQGTIDVRIKGADPSVTYEVDAPNAAVVLAEDGEYRVDVSPDGDTTRVTAWSGHAEVTSSGSTFAVEAQQTATIRGDSAPTYDVEAAGAPDQFDQWARARNEREDHAEVAARYVPPDMGGLADLDAGGGWVTNADYGPVWFPTTVAVGWAPYSVGQWVWVDPWGWTWVDDAPWGWAPFHYGRWAFIGGAWGWCPGPLIVGPVWGPGFVTFIGGSTWGTGIGWFPLGPREPYIPYYRTGIQYRERINVATVSAVTTYRNRSVPGAVTAVSSSAFRDGAPVERSAMHLSESQVAGARVLGSGPSIAPTRASLVGSRDADRPSAAPPSRLATRSVVALHAPPPPAVRFSAEERSLGANGGRPLAASELSSLRSTDPTAQQARAPIRSAAAPAAGGRGLAPARGGLPAASPTLGGALPRRAATARTPSPLDRSYGAARQQMETRHAQEFARPQARESDESMFRRQESERQNMASQYHAARSQGRSEFRPSGGGGSRGHR